MRTPEKAWKAGDFYKIVGMKPLSERDENPRG